MDQQAAGRLIADTFNRSFDDSRFRVFTRNLLNDIDETKAFEYHGQYIPDSFKQHITQYKRLGKYVDTEGNSLDVLVVHLRKESALERARTKQRNFIGWYLNGGRGDILRDAALAAFVAPEEEDWRFSYIRMEYKQEITESGRVKVREELTPARRYSFLVGENEPNHTAQQQIVPILKDDRHNPTIEELEQAFSVEAVTKRFYTDYRDLFEKLSEELRALLSRDTRVKEEFESKSIDPANFAKKLLGQIVFLCFLQKKGWLGVGKDEQGNLKPWGTGPKNFLQRLFGKEFIDYENFFDDVLEPLFYEALATERTEDYYSLFSCKIPFLNGGLFEAIHDYNWREIDILLPNNLFQQIFDTFDLYNFTVREDEPLEKEVAVDPEMLGKVFENLLPENLRKGKGTYYTPRPIVHYMCQESLINYLDSVVNMGQVPLAQRYPSQERLFQGAEPEQMPLEKTGYKTVVPLKDIEEFIRKSEFAVEHDVAKEAGTKTYKYQVPGAIRTHANLLDKVLADIKVCDPAIGSGAFPVGMMHEIVKARNVLTTYLENKSDRDTYTLKRHCIQESLYGVDIDPGAIDIAKLRLWLSLIVDEEDYQTINPLPNLDYKIMQGNSLIEEFHGISLDLGESDNGDLLGINPELESLIEALHERQNAFFNATHPRDKSRLKGAVEEAILSVFHYKVEQEKKPYFDSLRSIEQTASKLPENLRKQYLQEEKEKLNKRSDFDHETVENELREMTHGNKLRSFFPWRLYFADVFRKKGGFDVVIANPPYVNTKQLSSYSWRPELEATFGWVDDLYNHFTHEALAICRPSGIVTFITSDTFFTIQTKLNMRKALLEKGIITLMPTPKAFAAMVDTAVFLARNVRRNDDYQLTFIDMRRPDFAQFGEEGAALRRTDVPTWELILGQLLGSLGRDDSIIKKVPVNVSTYRENLNQAIFSPTAMNMQIYNKLIPTIKGLHKRWWDKIKTSRDIAKNKAILEQYRKTLKPGDITLLGLITEGGVGLQTGDNGKFIGCLEGTRSAARIRETRGKKLLNVFQKKPTLTSQYPLFTECKRKADFDAELQQMSEEKIRTLFDEIKEEYDRDIFGQGYLYRIIGPSEVADVEHMTDDEKANGIDDTRKNCYAPYDKGDKEGNRWYLETPYCIRWDCETVTWLKSNSGKPDRGMPVVRNPQFYFREGFCWTDVNSVYLKSRMKAISVHDVLSMSLFSAVPAIPVEYIVCMVNSKFMSELVEEFLNNTSHFQINDARKIPIVVPSQEQLREFEDIFGQAYRVKKDQFARRVTKEKAEAQLKEIQKQLDTEVYELYNLTDEEIRVVEEATK